MKAQNLPYCKLKIARDRSVTLASGYYPLIAFMEQSGFSGLLSRLPYSGTDYSKRRVVFVLITTILALLGGAERLSDCHAFLGKHPELYTVFRQKPLDDTTYYKILLSLAQNSACLGALHEMNKHWLHAIILPTYSGDVTVDVDATFCPTEKACKTTGHKGDGVYPLLVHIGREQYVYACDYRQAHINPGLGIDALYNACCDELRRFPAITKLLLRSDAAGYQHAVIRAAQQEGRGFIIKAADHNAFHTPPMRAVNGTDLSVGSLIHTMDKKEAQPFRVCVYQRHTDRLFPETFYIATSDTMHSEEEILFFYNQRTHEELALKELKIGLSAAYIPSKHLELNELFFMVNIFAYNILKAYLSGLFPANNPLRRMTVKRFRYLFLTIAARVIHSGRTITLALHCDADFFAAFFRYYHFGFNYHPTG